MRKENRPTSSQGRVSYPQEVEGWSKVSTYRFMPDVEVSGILNPRAKPKGSKEL